MIGLEDAAHTYEYKEHYKILPAIHGWSSDITRIKSGKKVDENFTYTSGENSEWMSVDKLRNWLEIDSRIKEIDSE
jgi:hypothetical protein